MRNIVFVASIIAGLGLCGCHTVHKVENGTEHVAKETGHAIGKGTEKVGNGIANGGEKLEQKTSDN